MPSGTLEFNRRMHRALEFIDRHLDQPLELPQIATVAHFSAFHFHRVFAAWLGETFGEYLRRRRLEVAATRLLGQPQDSVLTIALSVGFGSAEAFARAFKSRFAVTPTQWRTREATVRSLLRSAAHRNPGQTVSNLGQVSSVPGPHHHLSDPLGPEDVMKVEVVERPAVKVAYLRQVGPYGDPLARFWRDVAYPWMAANGLLGHTRYGVSHDDPTITAPAKCRYDAAVEVPAAVVRPPGQALLSTLPGGRYGVTPFRGTSGQIGTVRERFMRDWLPSSGLQLDARPFLEYYGPNSTFDPRTGVFTCDLAIPVAPLSSL
jgi:AraC family transcriptional regulator